MSVRLRVVPTAGDEGEIVPLRHGLDPRAALADAGWHEPTWLRASRPDDEPGVVIVDVAARRGEPVTAAEPALVAADPALVVADGEQAVPHQRLAAYAVVVEGDAVLLTQLSERVHLVPGWWNLPGGGIDPGEDPVAGLVREVWEETDQRLEPGELLDVHAQHWLGRAPSGTLEDFQAVRLIYSGRVRAPSPPLVHDVGGSTAQARWVPLAELDDLPLVSTITLLREAGRLRGDPRT